MKLEEPCEGRLSSTVPWERKGETPLRDPIIGHAIADSVIIKLTNKINRKAKASQNQKRCNPTLKPTHGCTTFAFALTYQKPILRTNFNH
jgi:hypothetical protein